MLEVNLQEEAFIFHPSGALYCKRLQTLLIADVHLGKIAHFRKHGSAIPQKAILKNFQQLKKVVNTFKPEKIYFLGDLFHSAFNTEFTYFKTWVQKQQADLTLIVGNHDIIAPTHFENLGIKVEKEIYLENFLLTHHPEIREGFFTICGHIHPGFRLRGMGKQHEKLPCFFKSKQQLILPAFGTFTGKYLMQQSESDQIYVCTETEVIPIPPKL
ncbi:ligase-associated DNA damage response endonuclease PdeM [Haloflavibacter putidus]|uniref:Ligase-associated DNA damage response endonuclease PdeM n=1 Tax=Haloflavibacter putidus TaxID=2576776 RepID=A0A507ZSB3_9FLAO|nr:ligase-associated DNA damage response endonuclease PdeM [Haloflavibacter putidus]TQD40520.1 ligase-associated DNA damage response endonuclease PdeM [Haloflavibacter putidus]